MKMIGIKKLLLVGFGISIIFATNILAKNDLTIMTENWPPLNYVEDNVLKGPAVDIVRAIQKKINNENKILVFPWKRAYTYTLEQKNKMLFSMVHSKKRDLLFKWVGPIAEKRYSLYAKKGFTGKIKTLEDAKKFFIGVQREGFTEQYLESRGFTNLQKANNATQNARMLLRERLDLMFDSYSTFSKTVKQYEMNKNDFIEVLQVQRSLMYLAFNKYTPDETITLWQNAYNELYESGAIEEIFKKYDSHALYWNK